MRCDEQECLVILREEVVRHVLSIALGLLVIFVDGSDNQPLFAILSFLVVDTDDNMVTGELAPIAPHGAILVRQRGVIHVTNLSRDHIGTRFCSLLGPGFHHALIDSDTNSVKHIVQASCVVLRHLHRVISQHVDVQSAAGQGRALAVRNLHVDLDAKICERESLHNKI